MKKYGVKCVVSVALALLVGCQTITKERFFNLGNSDEAITTSVTTAFVEHSELATQRIHVETHQGTVILTGYVKTIRQSDTAGELAGKISGVKSVQNELVVRK